MFVDKLEVLNINNKCKKKSIIRYSFRKHQDVNCHLMFIHLGQILLRGLVEIKKTVEETKWLKLRHYWMELNQYIWIHQDHCVVRPG